MRRIVFTAIVAYTGRTTLDNRMLRAPEGPVVHRPYPLPVFGWTGARTPENPGQPVHVGSIESTAVCDNRLITFGRMFTSPEARPFVERLASGTSWLEIDVDRVTTDPPLDARSGAVDVLATEIALMEFAAWRLTSAYIGESPAWDLPPVQIEEFTV